MVSPARDVKFAMVMWVLNRYQSDWMQRTGLRLTVSPQVFDRTPIAGSIEIKLTQRLALERVFARPPQRLFKLLVEHVVLVFLGVDGLAEEAFLADVLFAHRPASGLEVFKRPLARRGRVRNNRPGGYVDFQ